MLDYDPSYGSLVVDTHDASPSLFVVVNRPGVKSRNWETQNGDSTVAQDNPTYDSAEPVVVVVEHDALRDFDSDWQSFPGTDYPLTTLATNNIPYYAFPMSRLESAPDELVVAHSSLPSHLKELADSLTESGFTCHVENAELVCEKFGDTYTIDADGDVGGDGVLTDRLQSLTDGAISP